MSAVVSNAPVRPGDVFDYAGTGRVATVFEILPGGRAQLRIEGRRQGKPSLRVGEDRVAIVKTWPRIGRAECRDGSYLPAFHLLQASTEVQNGHAPNPGSISAG